MRESWAQLRELGVLLYEPLHITMLADLPALALTTPSDAPHTSLSSRGEMCRAAGNFGNPCSREWPRRVSACDVSWPDKLVCGRIGRSGQNARELGTIASIVMWSGS